MKEPSAYRCMLARQEIGRSVVALRDVKDQIEGALPFGVKNTRSIPDTMITRLEDSLLYVWLTLDKMSDKGRSIDTDIHNPITYRLMTGSTSGGPVNILKGIIELALGTDGGGSVLGPAAATNLVGLIGAGVDACRVDAPSVSTDDLNFVPSIGAVGKSVGQTAAFLSMACGIDLKAEEDLPARIKIALPRRGDILLPDGADMRSKLDPFIDRLRKKFQGFPFLNFELQDYDVSGAGERIAAIQILTQAFDAGFDLLVSVEGPVDLYGYDETILRSFGGGAGTLLTGNGGKYFIKAANMAGSSAVAVPTNEAATTILVCGKPGLEGARAAVAMAGALESVIKPAPLFKRYFLDQKKKNDFRAGARKEELNDKDCDWRTGRTGHYRKTGKRTGRR
ncbi:MAG: hypothetical protein LBF74_10820 [Treponema sp.]|nr:hypothetical protein [Treponema sp.]